MSRVAIVTGASRGIGRGTAIRLARDFKAVTLVARSAETADLVRSAGAEPFALSHDLREPDASGAVVKAVICFMSVTGSGMWVSVRRPAAHFPISWPSDIERPSLRPE